MKLRKYQDKDYTKAYNSLTVVQKEVLDNLVKSGYRTKWNYIFAKDKGLIPEELNTMDDDVLENTNEEIEWELLDYTDHLKKNNEVRCKCGRALRYEYTVLHNSTGEIFTLGKDHFEQYTTISPKSVKEILKNFKLIDLEKKEILEKMIEGRDMDIVTKVKKDFILPEEIKKQVEVNLPLLDRQINRLMKLDAFFNTNNIFKGFNKMFTLSIPKLDTTPKRDATPKQDTIPKPDKEIDINKMINKLIARTCTVEDSKEYIKYFSYYKNNHSQLPLNKDDLNNILEAINKALGSIGKSMLRNELVDLEFLLRSILSKYL